MRVLVLDNRRNDRGPALWVKHCFLPRSVLTNKTHYLWLWTKLRIFVFINDLRTYVHGISMGRSFPLVHRSHVFLDFLPNPLNISDEHFTMKDLYHKVFLPFIFSFHLHYHLFPFYPKLINLHRRLFVSHVLHTLNFWWVACLRDFLCSVGMFWRNMGRRNSGQKFMFLGKFHSFAYFRHPSLRLTYVLCSEVFYFY